MNDNWKISENGTIYYGNIFVGSVNGDGGVHLNSTLHHSLLESLADAVKNHVDPDPKPGASKKPTRRTTKAQVEEVELDSEAA